MPGPPPLLRPGVLAGQRIVCAGVTDAEQPAAALRALGADFRSWAVDPGGDEPPPPDGAVDTLVWDGAAAFAAGGLTAALDGAWLAVRPVANAAWIPQARGGRLILLAPAPGDPGAAGARAGLVNIARTLSIEWARFNVRTTAILPGPETAPEQSAQLVAYIASPAGEYFSGCAFTLGGAHPAPG